MKFRSTLLVTALGGLIAIASCSDDPAKKVPSIGEAGAPGEGGASRQTGGEGGAGAAGKGGAAVPEGGAAGALEGGGTNGSAGRGDTGPTPDSAFVLFTVDAAALGLPGSALAGTENPQSKIFSSATYGPDAVRDGTNDLRVSGDRLGLAESDAIDAFAAVQPAPFSPLYWFSIKPGAAGDGVPPTRLSFSSSAHEAAGDVYFSDGSLSYRNLGQGSDQVGYNALVADEQSLGLQPAPGSTASAHEDNLTGVQIVADGIMPSELYFSVTPDSVGLAGSAVAATPAADRACTIFKSALDGTNTVAFTCADLGLQTNSDVTALVLYGQRTPTEALFALSPTSTGLARTAAASTTPIANDIFASPLDGTNTLRVDGASLGLTPTDELDALSTVNHAPDSYVYGASCTFAPSPLAADSRDGANLASFGSARGLGDHLVFVQGRAQPPVTAVGTTTTDNVAVYNLQTCAFVAKTGVPSGLLQGSFWTPVPLVGWDEAAPLTNLEYWSLSSDGTYVNRSDASGTILKTFPLIGAPSGAAFSLMYEPVADRFYGVVRASSVAGEYTRIGFPRPAAARPDGTLLTAIVTPLYHPCSYDPALSGTDSRGNSVFAQAQVPNAENRVCAYSPTGEFSMLPFRWTLRSETTDVGVLVPGTALYAIFPDRSFDVERYDFR